MRFHFPCLSNDPPGRGRESDVVLGNHFFAFSAGAVEIRYAHSVFFSFVPRPPDHTPFRNESLGDTTSVKSMALRVLDPLYCHSKCYLAVVRPFDAGTILRSRARAFASPLHFKFVCLRLPGHHRPIIPFN